MAGVKISGLSPVVTQRTTDIYEMSNNGAGSFRESRAQMLSYMEKSINFLTNANLNIEGIQTNVLDVGTVSAPGTISATSLVGGIVTLSASSSGQTVSFDTASNILALLDSPATQATFYVTIINNTAFSINLTPGADTLFNGMPATTMLPGQTFDLKGIFTSVSTPTLIFYGGTSLSRYLIPPTVSNITGTTYTFQLQDSFNLFYTSNGSAVSLILPLNTITAFPIGSTVSVQWNGTGQPTFFGFSGVTVDSIVGATPSISAQYGVASATKIATNEWSVYGAITA